jgi:origin recognition complex subunit 6
MNKKAVERDILGLLPSITLPLPHELTDLAVSLLAQSRSKASSLKPEEEIARGFACSHIACER